jgi:hypothetical protein
VTEPSRSRRDASERRAGVSAAGGAVRRSLGSLRARWTDERELADAVHGTVVGSAVMMAASLHGTLGQTVIAVVATLFVYWATERYAEILASGVHGPAPDRSRIFGELRQGWPMLQSAYAPVIMLLVTSPGSERFQTANFVDTPGWESYRDYLAETPTKILSSRGHGGCRNWGVRTDQRG